MMLRYVDLFCGIGGLRLGLESGLRAIEAESDCVFSCDIDNQARETYALNFSVVPHGDIKAVDELPEHELLLAGFPCQPFSYAGARRGFGDTRGTLFFEVERVARNCRPKVMVLENVRGLVSHDSGRTLQTIITRLEDLGYGVIYRVLNSADFGVPQNRMRIYIIAVLGFSPGLSIESRERFVDSNRAKTDQLSLFGSTFPTVQAVLDSQVNETYFCSDEFQRELLDLSGGQLRRLAGYRFIDGRNGKSIHSWEVGLRGRCTAKEKELLDLIVKNRRRKEFGTHQDGKALSIQQIQTFFPSKDVERLVRGLVKKGYLRDDGNKFNLTAGNMSFEVYKILDPDSISVTVVTSDAHKLGIIEGNRLRRMTPREVARLQGFPDSFVLHPSDQAAYRQLGNSVSVPVIGQLVKTLFLENQELLNLVYSAKRRRRKAKSAS